jgi:nitrogen fixation NifU-like protein
MDYSPLVVDHFARPRNAGDFSPDRRVVSGSAGSTQHGARFALSAVIEGERIGAVRHQVYGCPHSIAAASWLSERLVGATRQDLQQWRWREAADALQVPPEKYGRLLLLEDAVRALETAWRALS